MADDASLARTRPADDGSTGPEAERLPGKSVQAWLGEIERAEKDMDYYRKRCDRIRKKFRYESSQQGKKRKFQMLWANTETLKPATYSRCPKPTVENRWKDGDPTADLTSQLLERTLSFQYERCAYDLSFKQVRDDYILYARGVGRFRYEPLWQKNEIQSGADKDDQSSEDRPANDNDQPPANDNAAANDNQVLRMENVRHEFVQGADFIHPKCRVWAELPWLAFRSFLTRDELIARWGEEKGKAIGLDAKSDTPAQKYQASPSSSLAKATIYEIWDKTRARVLWIAKSYKDVLEEDAPYLNFDGFFPCPMPAYGTLTTDSLEPVPDYVFYQDQAEEIDGLTMRIAALQDSLKVVGFYPAGPEGEGAPEIERAAQPGVENRYIAVKSWSIFTQSGGGKAPIIFLPIDEVIKALNGCVELRKQLVDDVHQITGISDLMRGDTDPEETATAQTKKGSWTQSRLKDRQDEMARYCRDATRMAAEVVSNHFQIDTLMKCANMKLPSQMDEQMLMLRYQLAVQQYQQHQQMTQQLTQMAQQHALQSGQPAPQQAPPASPPPPPPPDLGPTQEDVMQMLRDDVTRRFRLDIETDSTILQDDQLERQSRTEFITAATQVCVAWSPIVKEMPAAVNLFGALLLFGIRGFKVARDLETTVEKFIEQMEQMAQQQQNAPPQIPPADQAKIQIAQTKAKTEQARGQIDLQLAGIAAKAEGQKAQLGVAAAAQKAQAEMQSNQAEAANTRMDHEANVAQHNMRMAEQAAKQQTLSQTMQMQEQRRVAQQALQLMQPVKPPGGLPQ